MKHRSPRLRSRPVSATLGTGLCLVAALTLAESAQAGPWYPLCRKTAKSQAVVVVEFRAQAPRARLSKWRRRADQDLRTLKTGKVVQVLKGKIAVGTHLFKLTGKRATHLFRGGADYRKQRLNASKKFRVVIFLRRVGGRWDLHYGVELGWSCKKRRLTRAKWLQCRRKNPTLSCVAAHRASLCQDYGRYLRMTRHCVRHRTLRSFAPFNVRSRP